MFDDKNSSILPFQSLIIEISTIQSTFQLISVLRLSWIFFNYVHIFHGARNNSHLKFSSQDKYLFIGKIFKNFCFSRYVSQWIFFNTDPFRNVVSRRKMQKENKNALRMKMLIEKIFLRKRKLRIINLISFFCICVPEKKHLPWEKKYLRTIF